jgi:autotransporter passenger strand-loop-strand repeat protein
VSGTASDTVVSNGGHDVIVSGGLGVHATVLDGGVEFVFGTATALNVYGAGAAVVESGGIVSGATISNAVMEISAGGFASTVTFFKGGYLQLDGATSGNVGVISGFNGTDPDSIDLRDLAFAAGQMTSSYVDSGTSGTLTIGNGTTSASLTFAGSYVTANFKISADGQGGTWLVDPPLSAPIDSAVVLDSAFDKVLAGGAASLEVQAGSDISQAFSLLNGDKLDLTSVLAGAPLAPDLANIGNFVSVLGYGDNDAGYGAGTQTVLQINGPNGGAIVHLEGSGKLGLQDLLSHNSLILPPH